MDDAEHLCLIDSDARSRAAKHATPADGLLALIERYQPFWDSKEAQTGLAGSRYKNKPKFSKLKPLIASGLIVKVTVHSPRDGPVA